MASSTIRKIPPVTSLSLRKIDCPISNHQSFGIFKASQNCLGFSLPLAVLTNASFSIGKFSGFSGFMPSKHGDDATAQIPGQK
jgi:hypothetical protein